MGNYNYDDTTGIVYETINTLGEFLLDGNFPNSDEWSISRDELLNMVWESDNVHDAYHELWSAIYAEFAEAEKEYGNRQAYDPYGGKWM